MRWLRRSTKDKCVENCGVVIFSHSSTPATGERNAGYGHNCRILPPLPGLCIITNTRPTAHAVGQSLPPLSRLRSARAEISLCASRACRICAGIPCGDGLQPLPGVGGISFIAASRIRACCARSSSVNRRLTCFSFFSAISVVSAQGSGTS